MPSRYQAFPGMDDILPGDVEKWQWVEDKARIFFESKGFKEIRTPLLEPTELFSRSIGEASDIVHKEMYTFEDRGGRSMTLRPEMTASVARAVIEHGLLKTSKSLRFYYEGPMFRAERPQAGRKRQFHQIGIEIINEAGWEADAEAITTLYRFLEYVGLKGMKLRINDLGFHRAGSDQGPDQDLWAGLRDYFKAHESDLCEDCRFRLQKNVLRIFDCKVKTCQPVIDKAPALGGTKGSEGFERVKSALIQEGIREYEVSPRLVRGLDYYTGVVFEIAAEGLGAQDAVAGGGRYDRLYDELEGGHAFCTGFSIGVERLLMALEHSTGSLTKTLRERWVYVAPVYKGPEEKTGIEADCALAALKLREIGLKIFTQPGVSELKVHLKKANQIGVKHVIILGADEKDKGQWAVKDLDARTQAAVGFDAQIQQLRSYFEGVLRL